ncbi:MAG: hypothetical protein QOG79_7996, partial [Mycobacterium sp.]|nr:hypothetical protein [Mycobacterium sp.]
GAGHDVVGFKGGLLQSSWGTPRTAVAYSP